MGANIFAQYTLHFDQGEVVYSQNEEGHSMFVIKEGSVSLSKEANGKSEVMATLEKGDFFGELGILENSRRTETATAATNVDVVIIHRGTFVKMLKANMEIAIRMMQKLSTKLRLAEERIDDLFKRVASSTPGEPEVKAAKKAEPKIVGRLISLSSNREFLLTEEDNLVGRFDPVTGIKPEVDLTYEDDSRSVSRRHAIISRRNGRFYLQEEIGVLNGTYVNGVKAGPGNERLEIKDQDSVNFGMIAFKYFVLNEDGEQEQAND